MMLILANWDEIEPRKRQSYLNAKLLAFLLHHHSATTAQPKRLQTINRILCHEHEMFFKLELELFSAHWAAPL